METAPRGIVRKDGVPVRVVTTAARRVTETSGPSRVGTGMRALHVSTMIALVRRVVIATRARRALATTGGAAPGLPENGVRDRAAARAVLRIRARVAGGALGRAVPVAAR